MTGDELVELLIGAGYSRKTTAVYTTALLRADEGLVAIGSSLDTATGADLRAYSETLPRTRSSRALLRSSLTAYYRASERSDAPVRAIRVPTHPRMRCKALDEAPAAALAKSARARGDEKGLAVLLGLYVGLRRNEIATLRWADIDRDGWLTLVGKGDRTRSVPLHPVVLVSLNERSRVATDEWVFPGRWDGPVNPTTVWLWVREVAAAAGLDAVPTHVLRHTALATALDSTHDLRAVQELAGHARPETTAGYTRVRRNRLIDVVSAIDYERAVSL